MKISNTDARDMAAALTAGADAAERAGNTEFDLADTLSAASQASLDSFQAAIDKRRASS